MPKLYVVSTPIGNLEDISLRALRILKEVDFVICEDTRVTSKLLNHYEIKKPLLSYFQHSSFKRVEEIIQKLRQGENAALATDAGTPSISDPGGKLVELIYNGIPDVEIIPIPGACAAIAGLSVSGLPSDKFLFMGFPPHKKGRQKFWKEVALSKYTVVLYESCHRIIKALNELTEHLDKSRSVVVARELTKMYETIYRGTIDEVLKKVQDDPQKGEFVLIIRA